MAEPTATSAGISLTVISIGVLGPLAGPYAVIAFASLAGALWPLQASETETLRSGAGLLIRCTLTAIILTAFIASLLERVFDFPARESLAPVALVIGALGNGWRPVFGSIGAALQAFIGKKGSE